MSDADLTQFLAAQQTAQQAFQAQLFEKMATHQREQSDALRDGHSTIAGALQKQSDTVNKLASNIDRLVDRIEITDTHAQIQPTSKDKDCGDSHSKDADKMVNSFYAIGMILTTLAAIIGVTFGLMQPVKDNIRTNREDLLVFKEDVREMSRSIKSQFQEDNQREQSDAGDNTGRDEKIANNATWLNVLGENHDKLEARVRDIEGKYRTVAELLRHLEGHVSRQADWMESRARFKLEQAETK